MAPLAARCARVRLLAAAIVALSAGVRIPGSSGADTVATPTRRLRATGSPLLLSEHARSNESAVGDGPCTPTCSWQCESPKCDQLCEPVCEQPHCETRCEAADTSKCFENCDKPQCMVICPERSCAAQNSSCGLCVTKCKEPMCMLSCPNVQPCHNVCEHPSCQWKCSEPPECPKPICRMKCDAPTSCPATTFHDKLPPPLPNEVSVQSFKAVQPEDPCPPQKPCAAPAPGPRTATVAPSIIPEAPAFLEHAILTDQVCTELPLWDFQEKEPRGRMDCRAKCLSDPQCGYYGWYETTKECSGWVTCTPGALVTAGHNQVFKIAPEGYNHQDPGIPDPHQVLWVASEDHERASFQGPPAI